MRPNFCPFCNIKLELIGGISYFNKYACLDHFKSTHYADGSYEIKMNLNKFNLELSWSLYPFSNDLIFIRNNNKLVAEITVKDFEYFLNNNQIEMLISKLNTLVNFQ